MHSALATLEAAIAAHVSEWEEPHVELAIHQTRDPRTIARTFETFCLDELGSPIAGALFYRSSIGAVAGVMLADGRRIVIKAHQPDRTAAHLRAILELQRRLAAGDGLAPQVIAGPAPLGAGLATVEAFKADGLVRDGHDPVVRRALAHGLCRVSKDLAPCLRRAGLEAIELPADALWPTPHSRLFDFAATTHGAGYIDDLARAARRRMEPVGRRVITHSDWRAEHVRFQADAIVVAYDWESLRVQFEPAAVGATAHMFCADWSRDDIDQAPSLDEARAFVADYESARGLVFTPEERRQCGAWFAYQVAYTARCGHASGVDVRGQPGNHQYLIARHGEALLDL
jgi:hypothetical protein